jgi:hypothetical protein
MSRRYSFAKDGLIDAVGGPTATQLNEAALVVIDSDGAHFTNDSYSNPDGGSAGAGLDLGRLDGVVGGRTVHVDLQLDADKLGAPLQILYFYFIGAPTDPYDIEHFQSYVSMSALDANTTQISMFERFWLHVTGNHFCSVDVPTDSLRWPSLLSFSLLASPRAEPDMFNVRMAIYVNGTRSFTREVSNTKYEANSGVLRVGRTEPCSGPSCSPFYGTIQSVSVDEQPLDISITSYDNWEVCKADEVPVTEASTTTTSGVDTSASSSTTTSDTSLILTGRDLDGGGAVGLDEQESSDNQGASLPLTLIIVLAALVIVCALSLGALFVWRSRRQQRTVATSKVATSNSDQPLPRSRSSKRRRGNGNCSKVGELVPPSSVTMTEYSPMPDGSSSSDPAYSTMPTAAVGDLGESGYRSLPSVDGGDEYRTLPADKGDEEYGTMPSSVRTHGYGGVDGQTSTPTYSELSRPKEEGGGRDSYASGNLGDTG